MQTINLSKLQPKLVDSKEELLQILNIQKKNLLKEISHEEMKSEGFVTMHHTLAMLETMHSFAPSVIIKDENNVAGYALTMFRECRSVVPALVPMFDMFDKLSWKGKLLNTYKYYVMGQICIDKKYRGQGLFEMLYEHHEKCFETFDFIITEISIRNHRSLRAHEKVGFQVAHTFKDELDEWVIVIREYNATLKG